MNNRRMHIFIFICTIGILLTGCFSKGKEFRPDQVIENALNNDETFSYYAEHETIISENGEEQITTTAKEWFYKDGSMRIETVDEDGSEMIMVNNTETIQFYDTESNELLEGSIGDLEEVNYSPKEEMLMLIEGIQETHTTEYVGEEELLGRKTHHIKAIPRDKTSLNGEQEFWFDAQYGLGLKTISSFGDTESEINYTYFEVRDDLEEELFTIERTDDMEVIDLDALDEMSQLTLEDMSEQLDDPVWYLPEDDSVQIELIKSMEAGHYGIDYVKDGLPFISLMIEKDAEIFNYDEDPEELQVNDQTVYYNSSLNQDIYIWTEEDYVYEICVNDSSITQQDILELMEELEYVHEN